MSTKIRMLLLALGVVMGSLIGSWLRERPAHACSCAIDNLALYPREVDGPDSAKELWLAPDSHVRSAAHYGSVNVYLPVGGSNYSASVVAEVE